MSRRVAALAAGDRGAGRRRRSAAGVTLRSADPRLAARRPTRLDEALGRPRANRRRRRAAARAGRSRRRRPRLDPLGARGHGRARACCVRGTPGAADARSPPCVAARSRPAAARRRTPTRPRRAVARPSCCARSGRRSSIAARWPGCGDAAAERHVPSATVAPFPVQFVGVEAGQATPRSRRGRSDDRDCRRSEVAERGRLWRQPGARRATRGAYGRAALAAHGTASLGARSAPGAAASRGPDAARPVLASYAPPTRRARAVGRVPVHRDDLVRPSGRCARRWTISSTRPRARTRSGRKAAARRLFPQGRGLLALLAGPPGTGKTMAAQVVAARSASTCSASRSRRWSASTSARPRRTCIASSRAPRRWTPCCCSTRRTRCSPGAPRSRTRTTASPTPIPTICCRRSRPMAASRCSRPTAGEHRCGVPAPHSLRARLSASRDAARAASNCGTDYVGELAGARRVRALAPQLARRRRPAIEATGAQIKYASFGPVRGAARRGAHRRAA